MLVRFNKVGVNHDDFMPNQALLLQLRGEQIKECLDGVLFGQAFTKAPDAGLVRNPVSSMQSQETIKACPVVDLKLRLLITQVMRSL